MNTKIGNKEYASILFFISETMFLGVGTSEILANGLAFLNSSDILFRSNFSPVLSSKW